MLLYVLALIVAAPAVIGVVRAALKFDRKMVEAGQRRRLEAETKAIGHAVKGAPGQSENRPQ